MKSHNLDKAIKLHELHMSKPKTATDKSQKDMMDLLISHRKDMVTKAKKAGVK